MKRVRAKAGGWVAADALAIAADANAAASAALRIIRNIKSSFRVA